MAVSTYQGTFQFVNKNGSNLTVRDAAEVFLISSHVTHKYYQWAKKARTKNQTNSRRRSCRGRGGYQRCRSGDSTTDASTPSTAMEGENTTSLFNEGAHGKTICWQLASGVNRIRHMSTSLCNVPEISNQVSEENESDEQYIRPELWYGAARPIPTTLPKQFNFDAPDWAACPVFQREALGLFRSFFLSYSFAYEKQFMSPKEVEAAWHRQATKLVTDKKSLHGWFASALTLKALYLQPELFQVLYPMALNHQNRSLTLLREYIRDADRPSESLILCIWCIATSSFYCGNLEANPAHAAALWNTVDKLGGIDALTPGTRALVILSDNAHSRFTLTRPHLHYSILDPGPFGGQPGFAEHASLLPETDLQFQCWDEAFLLPDDDLSDDLANYVVAYREFIAVHTSVADFHAEKDREFATTVAYWLHQRRMALCSWTMTLFCNIVEDITPSTRLSRKIRRQLQACICLAVSYAMSFIYSFTLPLQKWLLYIPIQNLRPQIELLLGYMLERGTLLPPSTISPTTSASSPPLAITHHEPLLFLFFVGACAEQISADAGKRRELLVDKRWHSARFCEMSRILGLRTWREARRVLQRFLYGDGIVFDRFVEGLFEFRREMGPGEAMLRSGLQRCSG